MADASCGSTWVILWFLFSRTTRRSATIVACTGVFRTTLQAKEGYMLPTE